MPRSRKDSLTAAFTLLLTLCLFVWPVVAGIPQGNGRLLWILVATVMALASVTAFRRAVGDAPYAVRIGPVPWLPAIALPTAVLLMGTMFPVIAFGDEAVIAAGGRTAAYAMFLWLTPMGTAIAVAIAACAVFLMMYRGLYRTTLVLLLCGAVAAGIAAHWLPTSGIALRYPPVVHLMQTAATLLTGGSASLFRAPNALWTLLLVWVLWRMTPQWNPAARWMALAGITLGPLGWPYRIVLYQACGELTFGAACTFVIAGVMRHPHERWRGGVLGALCALWILYRPTALVAYAALVGVLLLRQRWKAAADVSLIALPVAGSWFALAPLFASQYGIVTDDGGLLPLVAGSIFAPFIAALAALPTNLHPAGIAALFLSVTAACVFGTRDHRWMLFAAVLMAIATGAAQNFVTDPIVYGVARYSVLLLVPQGVAFGILAQSADARARFAAAICVVVLVAITPWQLVRFMQEQRLPGRDVYRMPTEGYLVSPLPDVVRASLMREELPVVIAPDYQFLELVVADGLITPQQRADIVQAGMMWTVNDQRRPVIVQAPVTTTYQPNLPQDREARLIEARTWALAQSGARIERLGIEEAVIVP